MINNNIKAGRREYRTVSDYCMASKIVGRPFKTQRSTVGALILGPARSDLSSNRERSRGGEDGKGDGALGSVKSLK